MIDFIFKWDNEEPKTRYVIKINNIFIEFLSSNPRTHFRSYSIVLPESSNTPVKSNQIESYEFGNFSAMFTKSGVNETHYGNFGFTLQCRKFIGLDLTNSINSFKEIFLKITQTENFNLHESFSNIPKDIQFFELSINGRKWLNFFSGTSSYSYHYFFYTFIDDWILAFNVYEHGINSPPKELDLETLKVVQKLMVEFLEGVNIYDENDPEVKDLPPPGAYPPAGETIVERDEPLW